MNQSPYQPIAKKVAKVVLLLIALLAVFLWIRSYSFVSVSISPNSQGDTTVRFVNQDTGEVTNLNTAENIVKKLLKRASYEVYVTRNSDSFVSLISTKGFFQTTNVDAHLSSENGVAYVGQEPAGCMYFHDILYSYDCAQAIDTLRAHQPASSEQPTFTSIVSEGGSLIEGIITTSETPHILLKLDGNRGHTIYPLKTDFSFADPQPLKDMQANVDYSVVESNSDFNSDFIVYSSSLEDIKHYKNLDSKPHNIRTVSPPENISNPVNLSVYGSKIAALYNSFSEQDGEHFNMTQNSSRPIDGESEIVIYEGDDHTSKSFDKLFTKAVLCGSNQLCAISGTIMQIYDIESKPRLIFQMQDVQEVNYIDDKVVVVTSDNVIELDSTKFTGQVTYSLGEYQYCGFSHSGDTYMVCIVNPFGASSAVRIDHSQPTDNIDKKILELSKLSDIEDVSPYGNFIYISPNAGELEYRVELQGFGYNPEIVKSANEKINREIDRLGIDRSKYQIINTLE